MMIPDEEHEDAASQNQGFANYRIAGTQDDQAEDGAEAGHDVVRDRRRLALT
jgi:hypothetical protein